ncbi:aminotransferase class III-fold pyridoxal phosphate-dependent enzyme [Candidatus Pelagibacter sp.]|nr:aminotransferase class III-fold pyridoxal phosphate-dependent enzyme [Candidatus Pelagibacter sp.]
MKLNNKILWEKAKKIIPGGNGLLSKRPERFLPNGWPTYFKKASGVFIWDLNNRKYVDMTLMGIGTSVLGYNNKFVNNFVKDKIDKGINTTLNCYEEYELSRELLKIDKFADQVRFARGGGEAMSLAIRIARSKSKKTKIIFSGYHGWHDWYLSANIQSIKNLNNHLLKNLKPLGVPKIYRNSAIPLEFNNINQLNKLSKIKNLAAIVVEPSRMEKLSKKFVNELNKICKKKKIILIVDEITSGWRDCKGGIYKKIGLNPDIVVYGKALGNGFAISAVIGKKKIMDIAQDTFVSSTAWTERVGFAAGLAVLKFHNKTNVFNHNKNIGKQIKKGWIELAKKHGLKIEVNSLDTIINFNFLYKNKNDFLITLFTELLLKDNFLANNNIYISFSHNKKIVLKYLKAVDKAFYIISNYIKNKNVKLKSKVRKTNYMRVS